MVSCILGGNSVHDKCLTAGRYLGVLEAVPFVACSVGEVNIGEELTVCFVKEDDADSSLSHQLTSHFETKDRSAAFVIINGKTITFVRREDNTIIAMDSHAGAQHGAVVANS